MAAHPDTIVLGPSIYLIRFVVIYIDIIKLADLRMCAFEPAGTVIIGYVYTTIIAIDYVTRAFRVDPECVMIRVNIIRIQALPGFSAVL
jgi:hypothetical protein